jgi:flagellar capping protein FliD
MAAVAFDTLKFARALRDKADFSQVQAEGLAEAFAEAAKEQLVLKPDIVEAQSLANDNDLSLDKKIDALDRKVTEGETRLDAKINALDIKIDAVETRLNTKIDAVETRLNTKIDALDVKIDAKIEKIQAENRGEFKLLRWMLGFVLAAVMGIFYMLFRKF